MSKHYKVVIIGGGTAGITVAARLAPRIGGEKIALIEPSKKHYYQPMWTLVGAGVATAESTEKDESTLIPQGVNWIQDYADALKSEENAVVLRGGDTVTYDALVVAPGLKIEWDAIEGLTDALQNDPRVATNYSFQYAPKTWKAMHAFKGGTALFTHPATPIKCGGAPQKIMYLFEDYVRGHGLRDKTKVCAYFQGAGIFGVAAFGDVLTPMLKERGIEFHGRYDLIKVDREKSEATFRHLDDGHEETVHYDFLHATPKMGPPDFVKNSAFATTEVPTGWMKVDPFTLQSPDFKNVFGIGDVAQLPTAKTGAGVRKQAPVVVENLLAVLDGREPTKKYNGYTSCPLVTRYGRVMMAEFGYDDKLMPSFPLDPRKERWSMWLIKKFMLPILYWKFMLRGKA
ncbi:MAG TPA: FAD/NAD(P)-binding oxidoreductase [Fimbriimonadaceae bacterium]|nr:FAD/NAD(P)-binding oxidoreductase [Fimbriimonadaceae bacterium]